MRLINFAGNVDKMDEFHRLHPMLQAVFFDAAMNAYRYYELPLLITSIKTDFLTGEERTKGVHSVYRGIDVDVCDGAVYEDGLLPAEAEGLVGVINSRWQYDPTRPDMRVAIYGDLDPAGQALEPHSLSGASKDGGDMSKNVALGEVELERLKLSVSQFLTFELADELKARESIHAFYARDMIAAQFNARVWAEDLLPDAINIQYPLNWKEAFKERWFPSFLQRKFPVKYVTRYIELKAIYPKLKLARPSEPCIIHGIEGGQTIARHEPNTED